MKKGRHYLESEIKILLHEAIGKTFREIRDEEMITIDEDNKMQKGSLGDIIEASLFGIEPNGDSAPDFIDAGIELKVTPYKINNDKTLSAKERLVLNMIDFKEEYKYEFETSHFWFKNKKLQLVWYLYQKELDRLDLKITHEKLLELDMSEDFQQIKEDWNFIIDKIKAGKAHELSEGDTMYLGACPKGANSKDVTKQPFSDELAMRRAFCFKSSYMTQLVRKYIGNYSDVEKILTGTSKNFMAYVDEIINKYIGKSRTELKEIFGIESESKSVNTLIINKMFGVKGSLSDTDEFLKANISPRTIRVEENGRIKESFPFPTFKYTEIVNEEWENSEFRELIENTKYLFFVFKHDGTDYIFKGVKLWNIPEDDIESNIKVVWEKTKDIVLNGNIVNGYDVDGSRITNFPGMSSNPVCHVRPHAQNAMDTYPLPVVDNFTGAMEYTKHCFWLNNSYIMDVLKDVIES